MGGLLGHEAVEGHDATQRGLDVVGAVAVAAHQQVAAGQPEQAELRRKIEERWPQNDKRAYLASLDAIIGWGVRERLDRITCPTLVISADHDYTPVERKREYVAEMPNAHLLVIENSRHATPLDQPERFNNALLAFLGEIANKEN